MEKDQNNIWYLAGPMFQYNEDVKALARLAGLKIVDATVAVDRVNAAEEVPEVTIKAEYAERAMHPSGDRVPTMAELLAARDQLLERECALDERAQRLAEAEERVADQARANEIEAQRLSAQLVTIQAERSTAVAAAAAAAASAAAVTTSTEKPAKAAKA